VTARLLGKGACAVARAAHAALALLATTACACGALGPTSALYTGTSPRSDAVLTEAARDLACPLKDLRVVRETGRRFRNETAFRFVVEGCGERGGYVEECDLVGEPTPPGWSPMDGALACRYLLVTRLRIAPAPAP
jgi:hypothetical protein